MNKIINKVGPLLSDTLTLILQTSCIIALIMRKFTFYQFIVSISLLDIGFILKHNNDKE